MDIKIIKRLVENLGTDDKSLNNFKKGYLMAKSQDQYEQHAFLHTSYQHLGYEKFCEVFLTDNYKEDIDYINNLIFKFSLTSKHIPEFLEHSKKYKINVSYIDGSYLSLLFDNLDKTKENHQEMKIFIKDTITVEDFFNIIMDIEYYISVDNYKSLEKLAENKKIPQKIKDMGMIIAVSYSGINKFNYYLSKGADIEMKSLNKEKPLYLSRHIIPRKTNAENNPSGSVEIRKILIDYYKDKPETENFRTFKDAYLNSSNTAIIGELSHLLANGDFKLETGKNQYKYAKALQYNNTEDFVKIISSVDKKDLGKMFVDRIFTNIVKSKDVDKLIAMSDMGFLIDNYAKKDIQKIITDKSYESFLKICENINLNKKLKSNIVENKETVNVRVKL